MKVMDVMDKMEVLIKVTEEIGLMEGMDMDVMDVVGCHGCRRR
jgi:hypothetical protein